MNDKLENMTLFVNWINDQTSNLIIPVRVGVGPNHKCNFPKPEAKPEGWVCGDCGKHFRTKRELNTHRKESGEAKSRPKFKICEFCGAEVSSLREHFKVCEKKHHGPHKWTEEEKKRISEKQRNNPYRRIMRHTQEYNGILYDSSWEIELAKRLEFLQIVFERPKLPIQYIGVDGKQHNYFPDFWVPKLQKYIEVKNPYLYTNDSKVQILKERKDIIWLTSLSDIQNFNIN